MRYKVNFEELKKTHLKWLSTPETSRGQLEDSKTILTLLQEIDVLTAEIKVMELGNSGSGIKAAMGATKAAKRIGDDWRDKYMRLLEPVAMLVGEWRTNIGTHETMKRIEAIVVKDSDAQAAGDQSHE